MRQTKPAPDVYVAALDGLGVSASEAVAFEDSPNGLEEAKAAGIYADALPNGVTRGWPFDHADRVIGSLHGIAVQAVGGWPGRRIRVRVAGDGDGDGDGGR